MGFARVGASLFALVLILSACGQKPTSFPSASPSAAAEPLALAGSSLPAGEVGLGYGGAAMAATGGVLPYHYQVVEGALPAGLAMSSDGAVVGTPTAAGDFTFSVVVADSGGHAVSAQDVIQVVPALTVRSNQSGAIYVESGCDTACGKFATQSGGQAPYTYAVQSGTLPAGTSLSGAALAGKFTSAGTFTFTVAVTDALGAKAVVGATFSVIPHVYFYCPTSWPDPRGGCIPAGGAGSYNGGLTFGCSQVASHPDCSGAMTFGGGSSAGWTVSYRVVAGDAPPPGSYVSAPVDGTVPPAVLSLAMIAPKTSGATASGTLLVTLTDGMICGADGKTRCSTTAYLSWTVQNRMP